MELTGNITIQDLTNAGEFTQPIPHTAFTTINGLYSILQSRGSLTLRDAILTLPENAHKIFISCNVLKLINSKIIVNSSNLTLICNEYEHKNSEIVSFEGKNKKAETGANAVGSGSNGQNGKSGFEGGNCHFFVTDKVRSINGAIHVKLDGQNGGDGGNGADGKQGARGSSGRNCSDGVLNCRSGCSNGGRGQQGQHGGIGGLGGYGGDSGQFIFRFHGFQPLNEYFFNFSGNGGKGGYGGIGGKGGEGGPGGIGGNSNCAFCSGTCYRGSIGPRGNDGLNGYNGNQGQDSFLINSNFEIQFIINYLYFYNKGDFNNNPKIEPFMPIYEAESGLSEINLNK